MLFLRKMTSIIALDINLQSATTQCTPIFSASEREIYLFVFNLINLVHDTSLSYFGANVHSWALE